MPQNLPSSPLNRFGEPIVQDLDEGNDFWHTYHKTPSWGVPQDATIGPRKPIVPYGQQPPVDWAQRLIRYLGPGDAGKNAKIGIIPFGPGEQVLRDAQHTGLSGSGPMVREVPVTEAKAGFINREGKFLELHEDLEHMPALEKTGLMPSDLEGQAAFNAWSNALKEHGLVRYRDFEKSGMGLQSHSDVEFVGDPLPTRAQLDAVEQFRKASGSKSFGATARFKDNKGNWIEDTANGHGPWGQFYNWVINNIK